MELMPRLLSEITSNGEAAFPWKLHRVLEESERFGFNTIVSWQGNRTFKVHDPKNFEKSIMKKYFNQTRYKSFQRQLNIYGFERITVGDDVGSYTHHLLVRGKPNICRFMVRTKVKNKGSKAQHSSKTPRRSSQTSLPSFVTSAQSHSNMVRSNSCPGATSVNSKHSRGFSRRSSEAIIQNRSITGLNNESFRPDEKAESLRINNTIRDLCDNFVLQSMPSTIEDDFSEELFSNNTFQEVDFPCEAISNGGTKHIANAMIGSISDINNNNSIGQGDALPPLMLFEENQDNIIGLGSNSNNNITQTSEMVFPHSPQDTFHRQPILEPQQQECRDTTRDLTQQQMQMQMQERRQQEECQLLQLQIQQLQNRIVSINEQERTQQSQRQTAPKTNSNYLCNGVAAIEPSDRGTVTSTIHDVALHNIINVNNSHYYRSQKDADELLLNPTPIFAPHVLFDRRADMNRSCSFGSFTQSTSRNVLL